MNNIDKTMSNETNEVINSTNDTETTANQDVEIDLDLDADEMDVEEDKDKIIATLKAQKDHWKKKATAPKDEKPVAKKEEVSDAKFSTKDYLALAKANIEADDIDEVSEYAALKKISLSDALKSPLVKAILKEKSEQRQASLATNVSTGKRSVSKASEEQLIEKASKGEMPESDEDMLRLVKARKGLK